VGFAQIRGVCARRRALSFFLLDLLVYETGYTTQVIIVGSLW